MRIQWRALGKRHPIGTCAKDKAITLGTGRGELWLGELDARKSVGPGDGQACAILSGTKGGLVKGGLGLAIVI